MSSNPEKIDDNSKEFTKNTLDLNSEENHNNKIEKNNQSKPNGLLNRLKTIQTPIFVQNFWNKFKIKFHEIFIRDFKITKLQILKLMIKSLIVGLLISFFLDSVIEGVPNFWFPYQLQTTIFIAAGVAVLFGGIITDYLIKYSYLFEIMACFTILPIFLMLNVDVEIIITISTFIIGIVSALLLILLFTEILRITDLLNRARVVMFLLTTMVLLTTPFTIVIITLNKQAWIILLILILSGISIFITQKFPEELLQAIKHVEPLSFKNYFEIIRKSGGIPYIFFFLLTSTILGFFASAAVEASFKTRELILVIIVAIVSIPLVAGILDNVGRKTAAYLTLLLIGIFCIFFDYPASTPFALIPFRLAVYVFSALILLIFSLVVSGDVSSIYSRGKITGVFIFMTIIGFILGSIIRINFFTVSDFEDPSFISQVSDISTLVIFIVIIAFTGTKDPFEENTTKWKEYLERLYIISDNGLSLFNIDFKHLESDSEVIDDETPNEDLVSGGLTGLQAMLKEISMSESNIEVVNHGDKQLIFHYGKYSNAAMIVTNDLVILREKLANFHNTFEFINEKRLENWTGDVSGLIGLEKLSLRYFE